MTQQIVTPAQFDDLLTNSPVGVTIELTKLPTGAIAVVTPNPTKTQMLQKYLPLRGVGISLSDAAQKYNVPRNTIENWVYRAGYVNFVDETAYPKLVDEAEVAVCAEVYNLRRGTSLAKGGAPFFDDAGALVTDLKHPGLSAYRRAKKAM